jgi:hypothetical protein
MFSQAKMDWGNAGELRHWWRRIGQDMRGNFAVRIIEQSSRSCRIVDTAHKCCLIIPWKLLTSVLNGHDEVWARAQP